MRPGNVQKVLETIYQMAKAASEHASNRGDRARYATIANQARDGLMEFEDYKAGYLKAEEVER